MKNETASDTLFNQPHTTQTNQMTYKELLLQLQQLTEEQLNADVCLYHNHEFEYYQSDVELVFATYATKRGGVNHPIICF